MSIFSLETCLQMGYELVVQQKERPIVVHHFPKRPTVLNKIDLWYFKVQFSEQTLKKNGISETHGSVGDQSEIVV